MPVIRTGRQDRPSLMAGGFYRLEHGFDRAGRDQRPHQNTVLPWVADGDALVRPRQPIDERLADRAVNDQPPTVLSAGEVFFESFDAPGDVHAVSGNASATQPAKILAMVFTKKGDPVTIPG